MLLTRFLPTRLMPHLVAMGTPFLEIVPSDLSAIEIFSILSIVIFFDAIIGAAIFEALTIVEPGFGATSSAFISGFLDLLASMVAAVLFLAVGYLLLFALVGPLVTKTRNTLSSRLHKAAWGGLTMKQGYKILVLRGTDDEASLTLALGALAAWRAKLIPPDATRVVAGLRHSIYEHEDVVPAITGSTALLPSPTKTIA
jgi:hypothetical protein